MSTQEIKVANVKCGGCAANIKTGLSALDSVASVDVDVATGQVVVTAQVSRTVLTAKLAELGHPEIA